MRFKAPGTAAIVATTPDGIFRDICLIRVLEDFDLDGRPTVAGSLFGEWVQCDENLQVLPNPERFEFWKTVNTSSEGYQTVLYEGNYSYSGAFYQGTVTFNVVEKDFVMVTAIISAVAASHQHG
ncbi:MAG: hypothetical protein LBB73_05280 [Dysgonamonadaceae bacterium]|nr:hypothetical protein [Dysgonamonadaceae bacterium]